MKDKQSLRVSKFAALFTTLLMATQTLGLGTPSLTGRSTISTAYAATTTKIQSSVIQVTIDQ
ncbi:MULTISPECIES: hypothetical protein [unclassified Paenibacillus]|uniref:hypothetical protein n=1 Tax=unclassified Paenibacillus TaxID=185978 RepID=UPI002780F81A|nr:MULTISPECIES: hypothetical protein [unclassified Paenibacillus]MDQ0900657.1 hypothetical protein [Paenibacillus sp. V4I7]MDQ0920835.1 hypothetical protein [Paenibacillus sp. V4I5]